MKKNSFKPKYNIGETVFTVNRRGSVGFIVVESQKISSIIQEANSIFRYSVSFGGRIKESEIFKTKKEAVEFAKKQIKSIYDGNMEMVEKLDYYPDEFGFNREILEINE